MKIYKKKGKRLQEEKTLIADIAEGLEQYFEKDPSLMDKFIPAETLDELKELHKRYAKPTSYSEVVEDEKEQGSSSDDNFPDEIRDYEPMTEQNAKVRDYVLKNEMEEKMNSNEKVKTSFSEPSSFSEAFEIPEPRGEEKEDGKSESKKSESKKKEVIEPVNPSFNDLDSKARNNSTKQLAKYLINITCGLAEFGFNWFGTKDITDEKLLEYENKLGIDLSVLITMPDQQRETVREFFVGMRLSVLEVSKFTEDEKKEMIDALYPILLKKGVVLSPEQNAIMVIGGIFFTKALGVYGISKQISGVLNELKEMKKQSDYEADANNNTANVVDPNQNDERLKKAEKEVKESYMEKERIENDAEIFDGQNGLALI